MRSKWSRKKRKEERTEKKRKGEREEVRKEEKRTEQGVRKEGEEGGSKVTDVETEWVTLKRRTKRRRQQGRDETSAKPDGRGFRTIQIFVKVDGSNVFPL